MWLAWIFIRYFSKAPNYTGSLLELKEKCKLQEHNTNKNSSSSYLQQKNVTDSIRRRRITNEYSSDNIDDISCNRTKDIITAHSEKSERNWNAWYVKFLAKIYRFSDSKKARKLIEEHNKFVNATNKNQELIQNNTAMMRAYFKCNNDNWSSLNSTLQDLHDTIEKRKFTNDRWSLVFEWNYFGNKCSNNNGT